MDEVKVDLQRELDQFIGTTQYYRWSVLFQNAMLTDGTRYLADNAGAYWLMDAIGSYQDKLMRSNELFQCWKLVVNPDNSAVLSCEDGNGKVLVTQEIQYTDFPMKEVKVWASWDEGLDAVVIFLPSEY